ncbi:hypothetical protein F5883DRAFT_439902 [Diaporthe sp. PMI_573]|nr:hypothetical protein F5883DRAFT_439902 [Diaporthaceae sp. PMI_573]
MKHQNSPQGKVFRFKHRDLWAEHIKNDVQVPKIVLAHMVLVVGKFDARPGWVKVATVTKTIDERVHSDFYLPIYPTRKNRDTNMQLKLCDDPLGTTGFSWRSYLRVDLIYAVPRQILEEQLSYGRHLELQERSYRGLQQFLNERQIL